MHRPGTRDRFDRKLLDLAHDELGVAAAMAPAARGGSTLVMSSSLGALGAGGSGSVLAFETETERLRLEERGVALELCVVLCV